MLGFKKQIRVLTTSIFFLAVITIAFFAGQNYRAVTAIGGEKEQTSPQPSVVSATPKVTTSTTASPTPTGPVILVLNQTAGVSQVERVDGATKQHQVVFTDKDETLKIKQVGNLTSDGQSVVMILGKTDDEFGGSLWLISTDGSGKKTELIPDFTSPWPPSISPDGKKIVYVSFSNAERDGGFSLILANIDGTNKRELARESTSITQPVFTSTGTAVVYIRSSSIMSVAVTGGKPKELASYPGRVPYDLAVYKETTFVFVDGTGDKADLYFVHDNANEPERLPADGRENRPIFNQDGSTIAYASQIGGSSLLEQYDLQTKKTDSLGKATLVIGWLTR